MVTPRTKQQKEEERRRLDDVDDVMKDLSLITNTLGDELPSMTRKQMTQHQVMRPLIESTIQRLGSSNKAIFHLNRGLIHVLKLIDQAPDDKISTNELLRNMHSFNMHKYLKQAESLGYVIREPERPPEGQKGGTMVMNSLSKEGRILLEMSEEFL